MFWIGFSFICQCSRLYTTKENKNWTSFKNFAPKLNLNHNIYKSKDIWEFWNAFWTKSQTLLFWGVQSSSFRCIMFQPEKLLLDKWHFGENLVKISKMKMLCFYHKGMYMYLFKLCNIYINFGSLLCQKEKKTFF